MEAPSLRSSFHSRLQPAWPRSGRSGPIRSWTGSRRRSGIGGPVGSEKTALVEALCKRLRDTYDLVRDHQRQRSVVLLRDMVGASSADACRLRAISDSAQRIRLHRGRSTLRRALGVSVRAQTWR